jgi:hypothetical protein
MEKVEFNLPMGEDMYNIVAKYGLYEGLSQNQMVLVSCDSARKH